MPIAFSGIRTGISRRKPRARFPERSIQRKFSASNAHAESGLVRAATMTPLLKLKLLGWLHSVLGSTGLLAAFAVLGAIVTPTHGASQAAAFLGQLAHACADQLESELRLDKQVVGSRSRDWTV